MLVTLPIPQTLAPTIPISLSQIVGISYKFKISANIAGLLSGKAQLSIPMIVSQTGPGSPYLDQIRAQMDGTMDFDTIVKYGGFLPYQSTSPSYNTVMLLTEAPKEYNPFFGWAAPQETHMAPYVDVNLQEFTTLPQDDSEEEKTPK